MVHPVLFHIGPLPIFSYGVFILLGTFALFAIALGLGRRQGVPWDHLWPVAVGVGVGGILGGRLSHLIVEPDRAAEFANFYAILLPGTPGNIVGIMIGGFFGGLAVRLSLDLPSTGNFFAVGLASAGILWRIGCTLGGCCHGVETDLPWAITLENVRRHPTMAYEGLFNVFMLGALLWAYPRVRRKDVLLYAYLAGYAFFRFWLEFIRLYPKVALGLTGIQFLCLAMMFGVAIWTVRQRFFQRPRLSLTKV
jgi:phosphatidylglycerol:prolipoprotein diacylglycerol transferase